MSAATPTAVPIPCPSPVRCVSQAAGGQVLTGHEDGCVRAWQPDGSPWKGEGWQKEVKMHNTAVSLIIPAAGGGCWTGSAAGSIRQITPTGSRSAFEAKAPGQKSAHGSEITCGVLTSAHTIWTGAKTLRVWNSAGEWRQSVQTHAGKVLSMATADGLVWVGHSDGRLLVFNDQTAVCLHQLQDDGGHPAVTCLVPSEELMWAGSSDGHVTSIARDSLRQTMQAQVISRGVVTSLFPGRDHVWVGGDNGQIQRMPSDSTITAWLTLPVNQRALTGAKVHKGRVRLLHPIARDPGGSSGEVYLWSAGKGEKNCLTWGPIADAAVPALPASSPQGSTRPSLGGRQSASFDRTPTPSQAGSVRENEVSEFRDSDDEDEEDEKPAVVLNRLCSFQEHQPGVVNALVSVGAVFVTGGGDGSVRVWARGVGPYLQSSRSNTAMDNVSNFNESTPLKQVEEEGVPEAIESLPGAALPERMESATPEQMDLMGTGRSLDSRNSFFATPDPGWGSPHDLMKNSGAADGARAKLTPLSFPAGAAKAAGSGEAAASSRPDTGASAGGSSHRPGTGQTTASMGLAANELGALFQGPSEGTDPDRGTPSRSSFFATPDPDAPPSPHAGLSHRRPPSTLSPFSEADVGNDTWELSPESARGMRQWRCVHRVDLPSGADQRESVCALAAGVLPGGGHLLACALSNGIIEIWDCVTWTSISSTQLSTASTALLWRISAMPGAPVALFTSAGESHIYMLVPPATAGSFGGSLPWEVQRLEAGQGESGDGMALSLAWHNGQLCSGTNNGVVQVWDSMSYTISARLRHDGAVYCLASCGSLLLAGTPEALSVWSSGSDGSGDWVLLTSVEVHPEQTPTCLACTPPLPISRKRRAVAVLVGCWDGTMQRWSLEEVEEAGGPTVRLKLGSEVAQAHTGAVNGVVLVQTHSTSLYGAMAADAAQGGRTLGSALVISGGDDGSVQLWSLM